MWKRKKKSDGEKGKRKLILDGYPYIKDVLHFNTQYCSISPYGDKTLLKTPDSVIKSTLFSKGNRMVSEEFLLNYRSDNGNLGFRTGLASFFQPSATMTEANRDLGERLDDIIQFDTPERIKTTLEMAVVMRRSVRKYEEYTLPLNDLGTMLYYAQGISAKGTLESVLGGPNQIGFRNAPSGGGLYPIKLYCAVSMVEGIEDGIYVYLPYKHAIRKIAPFSKDRFGELAELSNVTAENLNVIFIYEYNVYENARKYGDNGCAYAFIEAGEISQNVQLCATALGYGSCDLGGYEKHAAEDIIGSDHFTSHVIHMQIVGKEGGRDE